MKTAKQIILKETGFKSIAEIKKHLKANAKDQYGCMYAEIKMPTFKLYYTSNSNHFCSFGVSLNMTGMTKTLALDSASITKAGIQRGCLNLVLN